MGLFAAKEVLKSVMLQEKVDLPIKRAKQEDRVRTIKTGVG
jgi:hypothetical protein